MPAYLIGRIDVHDERAYSAYAALVPDIMQRYGGRFLSRGQLPMTLEGEVETRRIIIVEFPDANQARAFFESPEHRAARALRASISAGEFIIAPSGEAPWLGSGPEA